MTETTLTVTIPKWLTDGSPVHAGTLTFIAVNYGDAVAKAVDDASGPCPECGLHTFGAVTCRACKSAPNDEEFGSVREMDADSAGYPGVAFYGAVAGDNGHDLSYEEE